MKKFFSKTIFGKVLTITFATFIVATIITSVLVTSFFGNYVKDQRISTLKNIAPQIDEFTQIMMADLSNAPNDISLRFHFDNYKKILETFALASESDIIITWRDGSIIYATRDVNLNERTIIPRDHIEDTLKGKVTQTTGTLDSIFDEERIILSYPVKRDNEVCCAMLLTSAIPEINRYKVMITRLFIVIDTIVILVSLGFIYIMSQRMSRPLKKLNRAAKEIAKGNFDARVKVSGNDEISELAATFNYMAASLKQIDDTQKSFIANVSHELRTPMTSISGFLEKILDGTICDPEKQKEYLGVAHNEAKRLSRLVSDMLDVSKMTLGQYTIKKSVFDITELIRLSVIKFGDAMDDKFLDVDIDFENEKINVLADKDAISRVITNLLDNAIKFSDLNSLINIHVRTNGSKVYVAIANDGEGISSKDINHIFERFYKTDKSRNNEKGTGLGLHMVQNILALHGETIAVKSVDLTGNEYEFTDNHPAKRTTFVFSLELA